MDFACSFKRSTSFHGSEGTSYRILDPLCHRFRCKNFGYNVFDSKIGLKTRSLNKTRKSLVYSGCLSSNLVFRGKFDSHLCCAYSSTLFYGLRDVLKVRGVRSRRQGNDSLAFAVGNGENVEFVENNDENSSGTVSNGLGEEERNESNEVETPTVDELRELLQKAMRKLEVACLNSRMFEEKAQRISEAAIALKDEAAHARIDVNRRLDMIQDILNEERVAKEAVLEATMELSLAKARHQVAVESQKEGNDFPERSGEIDVEIDVREDNGPLLAAQDEIIKCQETLENCEAELSHLRSKKYELHNEAHRLNEVAEKAEMDAFKAEEDVAHIMLLAEQAVAFELEATQCMHDAEMALQKAEKSLSTSTGEAVHGKVLGEEAVVEEGEITQGASDAVTVEREKDDTVVFELEPKEDILSEKARKSSEDHKLVDEESDRENGMLGLESLKEAEIEAEKSKNVQPKKPETPKDLTRESSTTSTPKSLLNKSSRFFSASFFSFSVDGTEFTPASAAQDLVESARKQIPKLVVGILLFGAGAAFYANRAERNYQLLQQPDVIATSIEEVSANAKPLIRQIQKIPKRLKKLVATFPHQEMNEEAASLLDVLWLLLASVIFVPVFQKLPGGSPVLGYLAAGILIGPYGLSIIRHVHGTKAIAEFGVVFLLFNIGLELSVERLSSMKKYVFGLGTAQVLVTAVAVGLVAHFVAGHPSSAAIVIGNGLALSSTAVVLQVLQERGESTSRHGRATFSVLLFQDLAVVVLLILIPLISPNSSKGGVRFRICLAMMVGFGAIAEALGLAAVKAAVAITAIIAGGRLLLRPIYKQIAENKNAEIFSANTLLVILGTSVLTARAGLSMALGAFLAGLLLAETEFALQVESDIAPYRGLLLGLFFMTVGMSIDPKLLLSNFPVIAGALGLLIGGKTILVALVGRLCGISIISAIRVGLLLAPGGEFAFVAFGEAVNQGIMSSQLSSLLFLVVGISMALTPWLAAGGQLIASRFELVDVRSLLPIESETDDLHDHIIICGFGRVGQIIAQLLSERLIPFVALDVRRYLKLLNKKLCSFSDRVAMGRALDLPVYFGDSGSPEVLHNVGAERACAAAITLDSPGGNYRTVWALSKHFPNVKTFVRAHDVDHGLNLEKAGATAVVPETVEPSLQLAAAVLSQAKIPSSEIAATINEFRSRHLRELTEVFSTPLFLIPAILNFAFEHQTRYMFMSKSKAQQSDSSDDNNVTLGNVKDSQE
ncbi:K(+) efflux antiporter 2, chloroplastic-like [Gossypium australe]|uniref:K(+) efflux antiporter 2, chloroplastic-like n=1 Tax=Gossypium australe TaxID=47621 RepID=A0A5B6VJF6_9ROSI|nr:K(+) efflux antiporter 2, chloroplastic-like [Gossypium australe]